MRKGEIAYNKQFLLSHNVFHSYISLVHQNVALCGNWLTEIKFTYFVACIYHEFVSYILTFIDFSREHFIGEHVLTNPFSCHLENKLFYDSFVFVRLIQFWHAKLYYMLAMLTETR